MYERMPVSIMQTARLSQIRSCWLFGLLAVFAGQTARGEVVAPPPPATYDVQIRYQAGGGRVHRLGQFFEMLKYLESQGFKKAADTEEKAEDLAGTLIEGSIPSANARKLLLQPRIRALLLTPAGYKLPEGDQPVKVQIDLAGGLDLVMQRVLVDQLLKILGTVGFQEAVGYDNRGHTRLVGTLPAASLPRLLEDMRQQTGWLAPSPALAQMPDPIRSTWPIQVVEVIPEPSGAAPARKAPAEAAVPADQERVSPQLRALAGKDEVVRMEVVRTTAPNSRREWELAIQHTAPGAQLEGQLGFISTVRAPAKDAAALAQLPGVSGVRLPIRALVQSLAPPAQAPAGIVGSAGLEALSKIPNAGQGLRIGIIDSDFKGAAGEIGKRLPGNTRYLDVAAETDPNLVPAPITGSELGTGTISAITLSRLAPRAQITLIRIDPEAPYQVLEVARFISGEDAFPESLSLRAAELAAEQKQLEKLRASLAAERKVVLDSFKTDKATSDRREAYFKSHAAFEEEERQFEEKSGRYVKLLNGLKDLFGVRLVVNDLVWVEGQPAGGASTLARYFNDQPFRAAVWFQAAGLLAGQTWWGLFRDVDGNGVMEFAPSEALLAKGRWTPELDFLGFKTFRGPVEPDLPTGSYRITMQWREAHDAALVGQPELYRQPLANLRLVILKQRDHEGKLLATDELEFVARSTGLPQRIDHSASSSTYQQEVEFTVEQPGRYALRVEGKIPASQRPESVAQLPFMSAIRGELRPRILVNNQDAASRQLGRPVFLDYATDPNGYGVPAGSLGVRRIDAAR